MHTALVLLVTTVYLSVHVIIIAELLCCVETTKCGVILHIRHTI